MKRPNGRVFVNSLVFPALAALLAPTEALSSPTYHVTFESEADLPSGSGKELLVNTYDSFPDLINFNSSANDFAPGDIIGTYSTTGMAYDGSQYLLMFESDADLPSGSGKELLINTYDTLADVVNFNPSSVNWAPGDIIGTYSTTGIAHDGSQYLLMLESDIDLPSGSGNELLINTYDTLADLVNFTPSSVNFAPGDIIGTYSTTGIAHDGSQYMIMFESDADLPSGSGNELLINTYDTLADAVNFNPSSVNWAPVDIIGTYSTTGLAAKPDKIPEPGTLALFALGLAGLACARRKRIG